MVLFGLLGLGFLLERLGPLGVLDAADAGDEADESPEEQVLRNESQDQVVKGGPEEGREYHQCQAAGHGHDPAENSDEFTHWWTSLRVCSGADYNKGRPPRSMIKKRDATRFSCDGNHPSPPAPPPGLARRGPPRQRWGPLPHRGAGWVSA